MVGRELGAIARKPSAYWVRAGAALLAFFTVAYVALVGGGGLSSADQGRNLFVTLSLGTFVFCLVAGIRGTSDALSEEKREGTLGLLFLTDLKGYDVVLGKFVSLSITSFYAILAVVPLLALSLLMGGVSMNQFLMMSLCLVNTLFFSLAVGIFVSTFCHFERSAMSAAIAILFVTSVVPYAAALAHTFGILEIWEVMLPGFLITSPISAFRIASDPTLSRALSDEFYLSAGYTHLSAWLCLIVSSACIAARAHADAPQGRLVRSITRLRQDWAYGKAERRRAIRAQLLDRSAFAWLAGRDRLKQRYAWLFLGMLGGLWLFGRWKAHEIMDDWAVTLVCLWFVHLFFKVWVASEAASRFIEDRRTNALELLLTTPLRVQEFAAGQSRAITRHFGLPVLCIVILNILGARDAQPGGGFAISSNWPPQFFAAGVIQLFADMYTIQWVSIWRSMHLRGANRTISQAVCLVVLIPTLFWIILAPIVWVGSVSLGQGAPGPAMNLWVWTILCLGYDVALVLVAQHAFFRDFREIATQSFDKPTPIKWRFWRREKSEPRLEHPKRRKSRRAWKIAVATVVIAIVVDIIASRRRERITNDLNSRLAALRQSGAPLTRSDLDLRLGKEPDSAKSVAPLLQTAYASANKRDPIPQGIRIERHSPPSEPIPEKDRPLMTEFVQTNAAMFKILQQLPEREFGRLPPAYRTMRNINANTFREGLEVKALLELETNPAAAAETVDLLFYLSRAAEWEPWGIGGDRQILDTAKFLLQRAAARHIYPPKQWRHWKELLAALRPEDRLLERLQAARVEGLEELQEPRDILFQRFGRTFAEIPSLFYISWGIRELFGQDKAEQIRYLEILDEEINACFKPYAQVSHSNDRFFSRPNLASPYVIVPQIAPNFEYIHMLTTANTAYKRILVAAADVEIYQAGHNGALPSNLREIGAESDPFNGKELHYKILPDGYMIYSVSDDLEDNGGVSGVGRQHADITFHTGKPPERPRRNKGQP